MKPDTKAVLKLRAERAEKQNSLLQLALRDFVLGGTQETVSRTDERTGLKIDVHLSRLDQSQGGVAVVVQTPSACDECGTLCVVCVHRHLNVDAWYLDDLEAKRPDLIRHAAKGDTEAATLARAIDAAIGTREVALERAGRNAQINRNAYVECRDQMARAFGKEG